MPPTLSRRTLLQGAASVSALSALSLAGLAPSARAQTQPAHGLRKGAVLLFQGDSITDAGRKKDVPEANQSDALGKGYPALIAGELIADHPELDLKVYNRGISGNKIPDLAERWQADTIDLKPDLLSILVGINDLWHTVAFGSKYKGTVDDYEKGYRTLIERTQKDLPDTRIVICEPFTLRDWKAFDPYRAVAKKLADELRLTFVPFQAMFDQAAKAAPGKFWLWDGVHPTLPGYALMVREWRKVVGV